MVGPTTDDQQTLNQGIPLALIHVFSSHAFQKHYNF